MYPTIWMTLVGTKYRRGRLFCWVDDCQLSCVPTIIVLVFRTTLQYHGKGTCLWSILKTVGPKTSCDDFQRYQIWEVREEGKTVAL